MQNTLSCAICGSELGKILLKIMKPDRFERFAGIKEDGYKRSWTECPNCRIVTDVHRAENLSRVRRMSSEYYAVDYANRSLVDRYHEVMNLPPSESINAGRVIRIRNFIYDWLKKINGGRLPNLATMLDIGSGLGVFLKHFLGMASGDPVAWNATAVDSDPLACKHLNSLNGFKVVEEMFPGKTVLENFDICTLNKIVEHIERPVEFLKNVRGALKQNGIVYIEVPDRQTIAERKPEDNILGALHCHLYDPQSITILIEKAGFSPIHSERIYEPSGKITTFAFAKK